MSVIEINDVLPPELPSLYDGPLLNLPPGAEQNDDGSVTLILAYPKTLVSRTGDQETRQEITSLTLHRVDGPAARKIIAAKDKSIAGFAASAKMAPSRANLVINALDAADGAATSEIIMELLGGADTGLPENATSTVDGVTLDLLFPVQDHEGEEVAQMVFPRMTVRERNQAIAAPDTLDFVVAKVAGCTPRQAHELMDKMDGADFRSVNRVALFLFGIGR